MYVRACTFVRDSHFLDLLLIDCFTIKFKLRNHVCVKWHHLIVPLAQNTVAVRRHHCHKLPPSLRTMTAFGSAVVCNSWLPAANLAQKNVICKFVGITIFRLPHPFVCRKNLISHISHFSFLISHFEFTGACACYIIYIYLNFRKWWHTCII